MPVVLNARTIVALVATLLAVPATGATIFFTFPGAAYTAANGINSTGQVVGSYGPSGYDHSYLRNSDGSLVPFDIPGSIVTIANGINDVGQISGFCETDFGPGQSHAFIRNADGSYITFDVPGGLTTYGYGINDSGTVTGEYYYASGLYRGFTRTAGGVFTTFDAPNLPPGGSTAALAIDDTGDVVGGTGSVAFIRTAAGPIYIEFSPPNATGAIATSINDGGYIIGNFGTSSNFEVLVFERKPDGTFLGGSMLSVCGPL